MTGAGVSAAAAITSTNAASRSASAAGSSGSGSPNTIGPEAIVQTFAAALVTAITGTALPTWRLRAETARPISESVAMMKRERVDEHQDRRRRPGGR